MQVFKLLAFTFLLGITLLTGVHAQVGGWQPDLIENANVALETMIEKSPKLESYYKKSYGYAVFPKITKAGMGVGGAMGKGIVYQNHEVVGSTKLTQASFGFQFGGQQYSEIIFFKDEHAFEFFKNGRLKLDAQASAVVIKNGASIDLAYNNGVAVFTRTKAGLMYEATVGGQHFKFIEKEVN